MAAVNNLRPAEIRINNLPDNGRYNTEDISKAEAHYIKVHAKKPRTPRADLIAGCVVVILEGCYASRRAILLKTDHKDATATLFLIAASGSPVLLRIDEQFLFVCSTTLSLPKISLDEVSVRLSTVGEAEAVDVEPSGAEKQVVDTIMGAVTKVKFMKAYLTEPFTIDRSVEFYSQKY